MRQNLHASRSLGSSRPPSRSKTPVDQTDSIKQSLAADVEKPSLGLGSARKIGGTAANLPEKKKALRDWFNEFQLFEKCIDASRKEPSEELPRVNIAVLDTGVDLTHLNISYALEDGRIKSTDFLGETPESITDLDGHGTHCASLLIKFAPNAEIYVGRVFRRSRAVASSPAVVAKKVDIISMSLGFTQDDDDIRDEIMKASASRILIFAAAANNTTNEVTSVRFPARMREVIGIFSSDGYGRPSNFNPLPRFDRANFIFPGEKIEGAWPLSMPADGSYVCGDACYRLQDGTSCSTPIAAAVTAGVLEFACQEREYVIPKVRLLNYHNGMTDIFRKLMVEGYQEGDNSFLYVKPWKLISIHQPKEEIPVIISHTLGRIDG
ncbi:hypothetical protein EG329_009457 [Mollisiaceae sp. DMI_Dod_QoI]|nr:hypothetical protein EG329_009457 [Helotiales sp. DMI_Dod_QoI]